MEGAIHVLAFPPIAVPIFVPIVATANIFLLEQLNQQIGAVLQAAFIPTLIAAIPPPCSSSIWGWCK